MSRALDLDRLADFAAGVLDPAESAEVARLVESDDQWASALVALRLADETVRVELSDLARTSEPMPADVASRVEDALRGVAHGTATVVSLSERRARQRRWLTGLAAAATLVLVFMGLGVIARNGGLNGTPADTAGGAPQNAPGAENQGRGGAGQVPPQQPGPALGDPGLPMIVSTGVNYTADALRELTIKPSSGPTYSSGKDASAIEQVPDAVREAAPRTLSRLTEPVALRDCLTAIGADHPGVPVLVDFANYEGKPALIVSVRNDRTTTVVAVGVNCGLAGADQLAAT